MQIEVFPGSPAKAAGVIQGDYIIAVQGNSVNHLNMDELIESIKGPAETKFQLPLKD